MGEYRNLAKNTVIFAIGQFSVKIIQFFLMPILTIALTTEDYGSAESIASLAELLIPIFTLGLQDAVFRFCMRKDVASKAVLSSTMVVVLSGLTLVIVGASIASIKLSMMQCIMFVVLYLSYALSNIFGQYIRGNNYIKTYAASGIAQALMLAASTAIFVYWQRWGVFGYLLSMSIAYAGSVLIMFFAGKIYKNISFRAIDKSILKDMLIYALPLIPNAVSWWFMQVVNRYILIGFIGNSAAGLYISSSKIATIINIFGTIFLQAWTISTVNSLNDTNKGEFNTKIFKIYSLFIQLVAFGILLLLPFVSMFLLQGKFYEAWRYSALAIFTAVISCYASFFGAFYGANMKTNMVLVSTIVGAIINTGFCALLVWQFGISGALIANLLGYVALTVIRIVTTKKYSLIKTNVFKELIVLTLLLGDAVLISFSANIPAVWYWVGQAVVIVAVVVLSFKDLKELIRFLADICKRFFSRNKAVPDAQSAQTNLSDAENQIDNSINKPSGDESEQSN